MSDEPQPPRIAFKQRSKVAQSIFLIGQLQMLAALGCIVGMFFTPSTGLRFQLAVMCGGFFASSVATLGFSYLVEYAARELTRMDRE
jgi:hypothetical protein